jgi:hypothetical protein
VQHKKLSDKKSEGVWETETTAFFVLFGGFRETLIGVSGDNTMP